MKNINVHRYESPAAYIGWIEPDDNSWVAFIRKDGVPVFYLNRDSETGAVIE